MHEEIMEILGETLEGEARDMFAVSLEDYSPEELLAELRATEQLLEGFTIAAEGVGVVAMVALGDCRERVRRSLEAARHAAGA